MTQKYNLKTCFYKIVVSEFGLSTGQGGVGKKRICRRSRTKQRSAGRGKTAKNSKAIVHMVILRKYIFVRWVLYLFCPIIAPRFQAFPRCKVERGKDGVLVDRAGKTDCFLRRARRLSLVHCGLKQPCLCTFINNEETSLEKLLIWSS